MIEIHTSPLTAEHARSLAERIFSQYSHTTESLTWLKNNPQEFATRISDFDFVVSRLNEAIKDPGSVNESYKEEVENLRNVAGNHIPSLSEAETEAARRFTHNSPVLRAYFHGKREFGWADEEYDPKRPARSAMGIFLEGYGRYVGLRMTDDIDQAKKIQKAFVYAFEAVLITERSQSKLLADILEWMKGDIEKFSLPIKHHLK